MITNVNLTILEKFAQLGKAVNTIVADDELSFLELVKLNYFIPKIPNMVKEWEEVLENTEELTYEDLVTSLELGSAEFEDEDEETLIAYLAKGMELAYVFMERDDSVEDNIADIKRYL
jgi:hypothetical protein